MFIVLLNYRIHLISIRLIANINDLMEINKKSFNNTLKMFNLKFLYLFAKRILIQKNLSLK